MPAEELTPPEAIRHAEVAATAEHIRSVVAVLRELDFADVPPAFGYRAGEEVGDGAA